MFNPLVSKKYKFICFWNAKCACGTIKTWFLNLHDVFEWEYSPHSEVSKHTPNITKNQLSDYDDYYKFIVVRNPWKRLVSYYKNKKIIMRHKNINFPIDRARPINSGDITFGEMVKLISLSNSHIHTREDHVANQYYGLEQIKFDRIVKVENLNNDMLKVKEELQLPLDFNFNVNYHQPPSPTSNSKKFVFDKKPLEFNHNDLPSYEYFYNEELKEMVKQSYIEDIEQFNYKYND